MKISDLQIVCSKSYAYLLFSIEFIRHLSLLPNGVRLLHCTLPLAVMFTAMNYGCVKPDSMPIFESEMRYENLTDHENSVVLTNISPLLNDTIITKTIDSESIDLSVGQAITFAMANNRELLVQKVNPVLADSLEAIERGAYDPELFGELEFSKNESSEFAANGTQSTVKENDRASLIGLRQKLPTGTSLEASVEQNSNDASNDANEESSRVGLTITQSLLKGLGPTVNLVSLRQAQLNVEVSRYELRGITESLLAETETSYWDFVLAGQKIEIVESSLAIGLQQLDEIKQRIEVGTLPRIEAAAAHSEVARYEQALIDVHSTLEARRLRLLRLINPVSNRPFDIQIIISRKIRSK